MIRNLENKVAWITGAGSGIGRDASIKLSKLGIKVMLSGRNKNSLQNTQERCKTNTIIKPVDVSKKSDVKDIFSEIKKEVGHVDIPPFVIEYNGSSWEPTRPATELRLIIVLPNFVFFPASVKKGTKYLVLKNTPVKLIDISLWYSSSDTLSISLPIQIPALFTNISIRIFLFFKKVENSIHEFSSATSIW